MKHTKKFLFILIILLAVIFNSAKADEIISCELPQILVENICTDPSIEVPGCMNALATNYNPEATTDDGSCTLPPPPIETRNISLNVSGSSQNISVTACDSDNDPATAENFTPYCAILQSGLKNDWTWYSFGPLLNSLNNIAGFVSQDAQGLDVYHYWSWSLNGAESMIGLNAYDLQNGDIISLTFIDPQNEEEEEEQVKHFHGSSNRKVEKKTFDIKKAFEFLKLEQKENGSFGEELYTDWAAMALASSEDYKIEKEKLIKYYSLNKFSSTNLTDYERYAIALMSLGLSPYNTNGENYIKKITDSFDGTQFGDKEQINDDIFALIVLQNAGYNQENEMIKKTIDFITSKQKEDGSLGGSVDMTGAAVESLTMFKENEKVSTATIKALKYLKEKQNKNGGWDNVSSTAWALEGTLSDKKVEDNTLEYLGENQNDDGGINGENKEKKLWETAYILSPLSGKTWNQIMQKFEAPTLKNNEIKIENKNEKLIKLEKNTTSSINNNIMQKNTKLSNLENINQNPAPVEPVKKQNWFIKLLNKIFGF